MIRLPGYVTNSGHHPRALDELDELDELIATVQAKSG
jgi:hypothetical protein